MVLLLRKILVCLFVRIRILLGKCSKNNKVHVSFSNISVFPHFVELAPGVKSYINDLPISGKFSIEQYAVFEFDNITDQAFYDSWTGKRRKVKKSNDLVNQKTCFGKSLRKDKYLELWDSFIYRSKIPKPWRNAGFHYSCFNLAENQWCAPSWIWTNAAIGRYYSRHVGSSELCILADSFLSVQLVDGGWIVRYDLKGPEGRLSQTVAPNDSAYICANTLLPAFISSGDIKYLHSAKRCAEWIMQHAQQDFLVYIGYELESRRWDKEANIVDVGFTADLFVKMYQVTGEGRYLDFAGKFLESYLETFYRGDGFFSAAVDGRKKHRGTGLFTRGHAWALEGLIPYYVVTKNTSIKKVIDDVVELLLKIQSHDGSWLHVYRPGLLQLLSGPDCKGTPVIAHALLRWAGCNKELGSCIENAVKRSVTWCMRHTATSGRGMGGIFSWNPEGAFAGKSQTSAACVYSNCYLREIVADARNLSKGTININFT